MKIQLLHPFELEVLDKIYTGEFRDITKKESKKINELLPSKELKEVEKINRKSKRSIKDNARLEELMVIIEGYDPESIYEARLKLSVISDNKADILAVGSEYGYKRVFDTITDDIAERRSGN